MEEEKGEGKDVKTNKKIKKDGMEKEKGEGRRRKKKGGGWGD